MHGTAFLSASQMVPAVLFLRGGGWQGASFHRGYKQKRLDSFSFPDTHTFVDTRNSYNIFCLIMFSIRANLLNRNCAVARGGRETRAWSVGLSEP